MTPKAILVIQMPAALELLLINLNIAEEKRMEFIEDLFYAAKRLAYDVTGHSPREKMNEAYLAIGLDIYRNPSLEVTTNRILSELLLIMVNQGILDDQLYITNADSNTIGINVYTFFIDNSKEHKYIRTVAPRATK